MKLVAWALKRKVGLEVAADLCFLLSMSVFVDVGVGVGVGVVYETFRLLCIPTA
jgi:hypothetical protein